MECQGICNQKYYANEGLDGYCSVCYHLITKNITFDEYMKQVKKPLDDYVKKMACSDKQLEQVKQKLCNTFIWNNSLIQILYFMVKNNIFFTAKQVSNILERRYNWVLDHLFSSRVIDTWNIKGGVGICYYISNNMKPRKKDFSDLAYPTGKIFQPYDIIGHQNMDLYNELILK